MKVRKIIMQVFPILLIIIVSSKISYSIELSELIELAKQNPEILKVKEKLEAQKAKVKKVQVLPEPMIEFGYYKKEMGEKENSLMFEQVFPYPGKLALMGEVEEQEVKMIEQELFATTLQKIAETKKDYYELFFINKRIEITNRTKEYLKIIENIANTMYSTGMMPQTDVLRIQQEVSMQEEKLIMLSAEKEKIIYHLIWYSLGLPSEAEKIKITIPKELEQTEIKSYEELQNIAIEKSPIIKMVEQEIEMKKKELELAKREFKPDFVVSGEFMNPDKNFENYNIKFGIMYPLYKNKKQKNAKIEAEKDLLSIKKKYESEKLELLFMLKEMYLMAESSAKNLKLYKTCIIPQANLTWQSSLANYKTGKIGFLMLLDNLMKLQDAELKYYELLKEYEQTVAEIERLVGGEL